MRWAIAMLAACSSSPHAPAPDAPAQLSWHAAGGGWTGVPCEDGLRFSADGTAVYACTTAGGFLAGAVAGGQVTWTAANTGIDTLAGAAIATHPISGAQLAFAAVPTPAGSNWFRSGDTATSWTGMRVVNAQGAPYVPFAARLQPLVGNMIGTWDDAAIVLTAFTGGFTPHAVAGATGEVRAFAATSATDIYAAVLGQTPTGDLATGGVFHSTDMATTWTELDAGIADSDKPLVGSIVLDPDDASSLLAALRGGGQIYRTSDAGATWTQMSAGLPVGAEVVMIAVSPTALYAATSVGLYWSQDGTSWSLAGFDGLSVKAIAPGSSAMVLVGVDDAVGLYARD
jgi:hypothetical protein